METKTKEQLAAEYFSHGFNCAQSVFAAFCEDYGVDSETALKIAGGLGGGLRSGEVCGAISGAVLVIGLKKGQTVVNDLQTKKECGTATQEFVDLFRAQNGAVTCRDLLGCDNRTEEGRQYIQSHHLSQTICADLIRKAVACLEELGY